MAAAKPARERRRGRRKSAPISTEVEGQSNLSSTLAFPRRVDVSRPHCCSASACQTLLHYTSFLSLPVPPRPFRWRRPCWFTIWLETQILERHLPEEEQHPHLAK